jgi:hypothetical protein
MTWVTLSNRECPPFFPLEAGIFDLARPLNFRGEKGVSPKQKCRGVHAPIVALLRGKSVTNVMRSCRSRVGFGDSPKRSSLCDLRFGNCRHRERKDHKTCPKNEYQICVKS